MADGGTVVIKFTGDTSKLLGQIATIKSQIGSLNKTVSQGASSYNKVGTGVRNATKNVKSLDKQVKGAAKSAHGMEIGFNQMYRTLFNIKTIGLVMFGGMVKGIIKADAEAQGLKATLQAVVKDDSLGKDLFDSLSAFARRMPIDTATAIKEYVKLFNRGLRPTTTEFERLIDLSSALGGGDLTAKFSILSKALGDVAAKGRLMGQEVRQFSEAGLNIKQVIGLIPRLQGKDVAGDYAAAKITFEEFYTALLKFSKDNFAGVAAAKMATLEGSLAVFADTMFRVKRAIGTGGVSGALRNFLNEISTTLVETGVSGSDSSTDLLNWGQTFGTILKGLLAAVSVLYVAFTKLNNTLFIQGTFMNGLITSIKDVYNGLVSLITPILNLVGTFTTASGSINSTVGYLVGLLIIAGPVIKVITFMTKVTVALATAMKGLQVTTVLTGVAMLRTFLVIAAAIYSIVNAYRAWAIWKEQAEKTDKLDEYTKKLKFLTVQHRLTQEALEDATKAGDKEQIATLTKNLAGVEAQIKSVTAASQSMSGELEDIKAPTSIAEDLKGLQNIAGGGLSKTNKELANTKKEIREILGIGVTENAIDFFAKQGLNAEEIKKKLGEGFQKFTEGVQKDIFKLQDGWTLFGQAGITAIDGLAKQFDSFIETGEFDLLSLVKAFARDLASIAWDQLVTAPLKQALINGLSAAHSGNNQEGIMGTISKVISGIAGAVLGPTGTASLQTTPGVKPSFLPNAKGNAFTNGSVTPFAKGGIVSSPTTFGMSGGGTGLMGEAGAEAIMPLTRSSDGSLGVNASSMAPTIIINTPPGTTAETRTDENNTTEVFIKRFNAALSSSESDESFNSATFRNNDVGVQAA